MKKISGICFFVVMTCCILTHSSLSLAYAALGLELWYEKMVPVLLPFMILSGTLIRMGLVNSLIRPVQPLFEKIFRLSGPGTYVILMGFLCGFPMGARTIADFRDRQELSVTEGQYLLSFCNNLGPVYFLGFVLPLLHRESILPYLFGMYGIPLGYGILLRYTVYRRKIPMSQTIFTVSAGGTPVMPLLEALDEAVYAAGRNILQLGGYMIFFNLLNLSSGWSCLCSAFGDQRRVKHIGGSMASLYVIAATCRRTLLPGPDRKLYPKYRFISDRIFFS